MDKPNSIPWPPIIAVSVTVLAIGLHYLLPLGWPPAPLSELIAGFGFFVGAGAIAIMLATFRQLKAHKTTVLPTKAATTLVTSGPFSFSRNPIYLANVMLIFALGCLFGIVWLVFAAFLDGIITNRMAILREEAHLKAKFGKSWRDYTKTVRRWI